MNFYTSSFSIAFCLDNMFLVGNGFIIFAVTDSSLFFVISCKLNPNLVLKLPYFFFVSFFFFFIFYNFLLFLKSNHYEHKYKYHH